MSIFNPNIIDDATQRAKLVDDLFESAAIDITQYIHDRDEVTMIIYYTFGKEDEKPSLWISKLKFHSGVDLNFIKNKLRDRWYSVTMHEPLLDISVRTEWSTTHEYT